MPELREAEIIGVPLTEALAGALASRPHIAAVNLDPANDLEALPEGVWPPLAELGGRLRSLNLIAWMAALDLTADGPPGRRLPAGLLSLTGLGRLDMLLIGHDSYPRLRLAGLEQMPLHTLQTDGGTPVEVWSCTQLSRLHALNNPIAMPAAGAGVLPPLRSLELMCWRPSSHGFPAVLCGLSCLTELSLHSCAFPPGAGLPPEMSQLRRVCCECSGSCLEL